MIEAIFGIAPERAESICTHTHNSLVASHLRKWRKYDIKDHMKNIDTLRVVPSPLVWGIIYTMTLRREYEVLEVEIGLRGLQDAPPLRFLVIARAC